MKARDLLLRWMGALIIRFVNVQWLRIEPRGWVAAVLIIVGGTSAAAALRGVGLTPFSEYFRIETDKLAGACLADLGGADQWRVRKEGYRRELLGMLGLWPVPERSTISPSLFWPPAKKFAP